MRNKILRLIESFLIIIGGLMIVYGTVGAISTIKVPRGGTGQNEFESGAFLTGDGTSPIGTSTNLIENSDKIGIGTTTPAHKLDVYGNIRADGDVRTTGTFYGDTWSSITGNSMAVQPTGDTDDFFSFKTPADRPTIKREGGKYIYIESTNVYDAGISIRDGADYSGTFAFEKDTDRMSLSAKNSPLIMKLNSDYDDYFLLQTTSNIPEITVASSSGLKINAGGTNDLLLNHDGGNVGIGTAAPQANLHIGSLTSDDEQTIKMSFETGTAGKASSIMLGAGDINYFKSKISHIREGSYGVGRLSFFTSPTSAEVEDDTEERMTIDRNGNVGIGTTSPFSKFSMNSGTNGFRIDSSGIVQQGSWNAGKITSDDDYQIDGTGTSTMAGNLDVDGNVKFGTIVDGDFVGQIGINNSGIDSTRGINNDSMISNTKGMYNYGAFSSLGSNTYGIYNSFNVGGGGALGGYGVYNDILALGTTPTAVGVYNEARTHIDGAQAVYGTYNKLETCANDYAYGTYTIDDSDSTGGTQYGLYVDLDDANVTNYSVYVNAGSGISYFGSDVGIGTTSPSQEFSVNGDGYITGTLAVDGNITGNNITAGTDVTAGGDLTSGDDVIVGDDLVMDTGGIIRPDAVAVNLNIQTVSQAVPTGPGVINIQPGSTQWGYGHVLLAESGGKVGVGTTTPAMTFSVQGDALADSWNVYSNIYQGNAISKLNKIKPEKGKKGDWASVDHDTLPDGVVSHIQMDGYVLPTMSIDALAQMNTKAVQELYEINVSQTERIENLEQDIVKIYDMLYNNCVCEFPKK